MNRSSENLYKMVNIHRLAPLFTMSVSPDRTPNLYCSESASEVVSSDRGINCHCIPQTAFHFPVDEESSIVRMFDSENDQMTGHEFLKELLNSDEMVTARCNAVNWMLKVFLYLLSS